LQDERWDERTKVQRERINGEVDVDGTAGKEFPLVHALI
jgi:hypothetical protein